MITREIYLCMKVLAWFIDPNGVEIKIYILKYLYPNGISFVNEDTQMV